MICTEFSVMTNRKKLSENFIPPPASFSSNLDECKSRFRLTTESIAPPPLAGATDQIVARTSDCNAIFIIVRTAMQHLT